MPEAGPDDSQARSADDKRLDSHFRMAPAYAGQLAWSLGVCALLAAGCLIAAFSQSLPSARALGLHLVLLVGVLAALWRMVWLRGAVSLEREERAEQRRKDGERAKAGRESLFAEEPDGIPRHWTSEYKLEGYAYIRQRIVLLAAALGAGIVSFVLLIRPVPKLEGSVLGIGTLALVIGFTCVLASRYFGLVGAKGIREAPALAGWLRGVQWLAFATALSLFFARVTEYRHPFVERWVFRIILAWTVICALELVIRTLVGLLGQRQPFDEVETPIELISVQLVFASVNPLKSLSEGLERYLGISLRASWGLRFMARAFLPLVLLLGVLMWGMTALEVVHPHEQGILEHWGRYTGEPLEPGLHLKWPWPIDRIHHFPATQVSHLRLGFTLLEEKRTPLKFILWTRIHADEHKLLLNEGNDLVSLEAYVYYRIEDVEQYAYQVQNPDAALEALAYRELVTRLLPYTLDDLLSRDRAILPAVLQRGIQEAADREHLGIEIVKVAFMGLHPPVEIADAYQEVVSAQIDAETMQRFQEAYRAKRMPSAEAEAIETINMAVARAAQRTRLADGRAAAFRSLLEAYRTHPFLFRTAWRARAYEESLAGRGFIVRDDALDTPGFDLTILNLRDGLLPRSIFRRPRSPG